MNSNCFYRFITAAIFVSILSVEIFSQAASRPDRGVGMNVPYDSTGVENINLQNGNLGLAIPLASLPAIAGGKLSFTLKAYYNSKLWNTYSEERRILPPNNNEGLIATGFDVERPILSNDGGWRVGGSYGFSVDLPGDFHVHNTNLDPGPDDQILNNYPWSKLFFVMPDGAKHEIRPLGYPSFWGSNPTYFGFYKDYPNTTNVAMRYYSVDGSYISLTLYPPGNALAFEARIADGTKIQQTTDGIQRIIDPNGNKIKIFSDSQGTHYQDEQTGREIRHVTYATGYQEVWYQTVGGSWAKVDIVPGTTTVRGKFYSVNIPAVWGSQVPEPCTYQEPVGEQQLPVVREIVFPQTESAQAQAKYSFTYNSDETDPYPATYIPGCQVYPPTTTFANPSKGLGELNQMTTPMGAVHKYYFSMDGEHVTSDGASNLSIALSTVTQKKIEHDGISDIWTYGSASAVGIGTVTNPDGSSTNLQAYDHFFGNPSTSGGTNGLGGLVYRETQSNKVRTERRWARLVFSGANQLGGGGLLVFNPVVTEEYTTLLDDSGNPISMAAKTFQYDFNGNVTQRTDYDWFDPSQVNRDVLGIPLGVPGSAVILRTTTTAYHNSPADAASQEVYAKTTNSILNTVKETIIGNADTRISYDNQVFGAAPVKGNGTKVAAWDSVTGQWVESLVGYDSYGNVISKTDPNGGVTSISYADSTHALPTATVLDPQNGTGPQTSFATYDYYTGLPLSTTDINGNVSAIDYTNHLLGSIDPFGRPGTVTGPYVVIDGVNKRQTTKTYYEDAARRSRVAADLFEEGDQLLKSRSSRDQLGRVILSEKNENGSSGYTISSQTIYQVQDRVLLQSNSARSTTASADGWTRVTSDLLGRAIESATFSGASQPPVSGTNSNWTGSTTTSYSANTTTVADQAGKVRRSVTNAIGQLKRVDEPNSAGQLGSIDTPFQPTLYNYDVLGNLETVQQNGNNAEQCGGAPSCTQSRIFTYSSLSRLLTATNPESGIIRYEYDANGNLTKKTDARTIVATYEYDKLNRVKLRSYSDGTPTVTYAYDSTAISCGKGRLASVSSSVSTYSYAGYDAMGRAGGGTQTIGSQGYTITYTYDLAGHIKKIGYPSGHEVNYSYDSSAQLTSLSGNLGNSATVSYASGLIYDAAGRVTKEQLGTDTPIYRMFLYNSRGQLAEMLAGTSATGAGNGTWDRGKIVNDYSLQCSGVGCSATDNNGDLRKQIVSVPDNEQNLSATEWYQRFEYDSLSRLTQVNEYNAQSSPLWKQWYTYDRYGNRKIDVNNSSVSIPHPDFEVELATNRLVAPGDSAFTSALGNINQRKMRYDASGNLVNDSWSSYGSATPFATRTYDAENRMTSSLDEAGGTTQYFYDGDGHRVRRWITNQPEVCQVYGLGGELLAEYAANGVPSSPQKEYGYRNGQLLIVAAAASASAPPPSALATVVSGTAATPTVTLNWSNATGATNYRVERKSATGNYSLAGTTASTSFTDTGVAAANAYLYKVCAANGSGVCTSAYTNIALGTAMNFTNSTIVSSEDDPTGVNVTTVKLAHITELRTAVNAVRHLAGMSDATWTNLTLSPYINKDDVQDLRDRLHEALTALGIQTSTYSDSQLAGAPNGSVIKKIHITQLRTRSTTGLGGSGGAGGATASIEWLVADQLGTPRLILDNTGSLAGVKRHDYLPFGEELTSQGLRTPQQGYVVDSMRQKFTLKERDKETGLDYFFARYYSSTQGRFISPDEFTGGPDELYDFASDASSNPTFYADLTNPQSLNKYQYTYNNPINMTDNDGHCPVCPIILGGAAVVAYILLSPKVVHAPKTTDTYREPTVDSQVQAVGLGMSEAIGGPIINKIGGKILSRLVSRAGPTAEQAALQAERQQIARLTHIRELGLDPAIGKFRAAEGQAGFRLEAQLGRRLSRDATGVADFVRGNTTYDLVGAGLKSSHFNFEKVTGDIVSHLGKADRVVVDVSQFSRSQTTAVQSFVGTLTREARSRIIILH